MKSSEKKRRKKARKDARRLSEQLHAAAAADDEEEGGEENYDKQGRPSTLEDDDTDALLASLMERLRLDSVDSSSLAEEVGRLLDLVVAEGAAATKKSRTWRNRVLVNDKTLQLLDCGGEGNTVLVKVLGEGEERNCIGTIWTLDSVRDGQVQLSKSMQEHISPGSTVNIERVQCTEQVMKCKRVEIEVRGSDIWSRKAVRMSCQEAKVRDYVRGMLNRQDFLASNSTFGLLLNGYFCLASVRSVEPQGVVHPTSNMVVEIRCRQEGEDTEDATRGARHDNSLEADRTDEVTEQRDGMAKTVGGLVHQVSQVQEILQNALVADDDVTLGKVPRGVLLHGPPGTGKTLIARSAASAFDAAIFTINGAEVVSEFLGQAEDKIRKVFQDAKRQEPSVIFIDEIDSLCPSRTASENDQVHVRIVSILLQEMDSLHEDVTTSSGDKIPHRIAVLAATNRVNSIDLALRRPGRFDREVEVPVPNEMDRVDILRIQLQKLPHSLTEEQVAKLARDLHGFVGADILALCREAGWRALRRSLNNEGNGNDDEITGQVEAMWDDFVAARGVVRPSALRELAVEVPSVKWEDVGGQEDIKQQLKEAVEWPLQHPEAFERMGIRPPQGVLLYGPPGCSKTLLAKAIATEGKMNFIAIKGPELFSKWVGESERAVHELFKKARMTEPTVIFFDEIDALATTRGNATESAGGVADRVLSQLLLEMDGLEDRKRVIVVAATNRPDILDPALVRPGRLDRMIYVPPPEAAARKEILKIHTRGMPLDPDVELDTLASMSTEGFSGAEIAALCREAAMYALEEDMESENVKQRHFEQAASSTKKQITPEMLAFYESFERSK